MGVAIGEAADGSDFVAPRGFVLPVMGLAPPICWLVARRDLRPFEAKRCWRIVGRREIGPQDRPAAAARPFGAEATLVELARRYRTPLE
jgi:hypothetical protein